MIYWKECRCFANTNTAFFLSPPQTIASHERCHSGLSHFFQPGFYRCFGRGITSGFLMPTGGFAPSVHIAGSSRRSSRDNVPVCTPCTLARSLLAVCMPDTVCTILARHLPGLNGVCMTFAWLLHTLLYTSSNLHNHHHLSGNL